MDFWNSARNPSLCNMKVNLFFDTVIFSNELPSLRCLPDNWSTEGSNFSLLQLEYSLVLWKFSEHAPGQSTGREIRKDFQATETLHISGKLFEELLKIRHLLCLVSVKNLLSEEASLKVRDPSFLDKHIKHYQIYHWSLVRFLFLYQKYWA